MINEAPRWAATRSYLMCPPEHFDVTYAINPWMRPDVATDTAEAMRQWARLRDVYLGLGHDVRIIEPVAGLPSRDAYARRRLTMSCPTPTG